MADRNWTKDWLMRARATDEPEGDLIADMKTDPNIPRLFANIHEMRGYLESKNASREALACVPKVWRRYKQWLDRNPFGRSCFERRMTKAEAAFRAEFPALEIRARHSWDSAYEFEIDFDCRPRMRGMTNRYATWREMHMRWRYPYGLWIDENGDEFLFNRDYVPIWKRRSGEKGERTQPAWIKWRDQKWFFDDGNGPWENAATRRRLDRVLELFQAGHPVNPFIDGEA